MMELSSSGDLRLTAIYGLVIAVAVIASGAAIGKWIDNTRRLTGGILRAWQNGRRERTCGGTVLLAQERNPPKIAKLAKYSKI